MKKSLSLLSIPLVALLLSGCTLAEPRFDGDDLLDTGYRSEQQNPVVPPVKEYSDRPVVKSSPQPVILAATEKVEAPVVKAPEAKAPEVKKIEPVKTPPAPAAIPVAPMPAEKKTEVKTEPKPAASKATATCPDVKKGDVLPPPAPVKHETLRSGDRLQINVFREKDLTGVYQINDKGMITFPLIGQVTAGGLKPNALQEKLKAELSKGYLVKPDVSVELLPDCITK